MKERAEDRLSLGQKEVFSGKSIGTVTEASFYYVVLQSKPPSKSSRQVSDINYQCKSTSMNIREENPEGKI